jgi:hypothetical protein
MNHIARLTSERNDARAQLDAARAELNDLLGYLGSDKFTSAPDADHVHVRTDLMPKLLALRLTLSQ